MNFLAHLYLSENDHQVMLGNFIGDFVKGKAYSQYDSGVQRGILLHREIDYFTDTHDTVRLSKHRLYAKYHHYAAVIVDVYYDHFLAAGWSRYHPVPLKDYTERFYELFAANQTQMPSDAVRMFGYMRRDNWLYHYQFLEGIHRALSGMARRTTYESGMEEATKDLQADYDAFREEFESFFEELRQHAKTYLATLS